MNKEKDDSTNHHPPLSDHHKWMVLNQSWTDQYQRSLSRVFEKEAHVAPLPSFSIPQTDSVEVHSRGGGGGGAAGGGETIVRTLLQALFQRSGGTSDWKYVSNLPSPNGISVPLVDTPL
jgi:hypothetical protein